MQHPTSIGEREVAKITGLAVQTLRNYRFQRKGFPYSKVGGSVRYRLDDILGFMESHKIQTSEGISGLPESQQMRKSIE
jgi:hypothetical protein